MFSQPRRAYGASEIFECLGVREEEIDIILRQLQLVDMVSADTSMPGLYRYNLNCRNVDLQAGLERYLLEVEMEGRPVHLTLDYSPSAQPERTTGCSEAP